MHTIKSPTQSANRRRLLVFLCTFVLVAASSLSYNYSRPPEYRTAARVQINPGAVQVQSVAPTGGSQGVDSQLPFLTELQVLTSRPVVEATVDALRKGASGGAMSAALDTLGPDPVGRLQSSLTLAPARDTDVVELSSIGPDAELAAALVNGVIATYTRQLADAHARTMGESLVQATDEAARIEARVQAKRRQVEDFRLRHNIVSLEREENEVLVRVRGLTSALNTTNEKLAIAEGKLRSRSEPSSAGKQAARTRSNSAVENLENRASQIREEMTELGRRYTEQYLALDNRARTLRARLADLDAQIASQRELAEQASVAERRVAISDATEEVLAARVAVERIEQQLANNRGALHQFTVRFNEYKALTAELAPLEALHRDALQRKARLEDGEQARRPSVRVLEPAVAPTQAWRPDYTRDAAFGIVAAFTLALLTMWVVELFNRRDPSPTMVIAQPIGYPVSGASIAGRGLLEGRDTAAVEFDPHASSRQRQGLLGAPENLPRELNDEEIGRLLSTSTDEVRLASLLLLSGMAPDELVAARWEDVDLESRVIRVGGASSRTIELFEPATTLLSTGHGEGQARLLPQAGDHPMTVDDLGSDFLFAAHDAGIDRAVEVTPAALRHTYLAFLARQGIRLGDLSKVAGRVPADQAAAYSALAPIGTRLALSEVKRVMDAVLPASPAA